MPLSEYESQVLERLEQELTITDPQLSRWLAGGTAGLSSSARPKPTSRPVRRAGGGLRLRPWLRSLTKDPLVAIAVTLMLAGAVLLGVAAVYGWMIVFAAAGAVYVGGLVSLVIWQHRRPERR